MKMIFVTPGDGARVRMPEKGSKVMSRTGEWVPRTVHYETLLACGDLIEAKPQPQFPAAGPVNAEPAKIESPAPKAPNPRAASKES